MNNIICYFNSNYIDIKKGSTIKRIISKSIYNGDIIDKELFISDLKNKKIFSNLLSNTVTIYLNHIIEEKDVIYYKFVFEDLNCNKIIIKDTSKYISSPTIIETFDKYILFYKSKYYEIIPELLSKYLELFDIKELKIISKNNIPKCDRTKYFYYNYRNGFFLE